MISDTKLNDGLLFLITQSLFSTTPLVFSLAIFKFSVISHIRMIFTPPVSEAKKILSHEIYRYYGSFKLQYH